MSGKYILEGGVPQLVSDIWRWGRWLETADRVVAKDDVGPAHVSTVFLVLDHNFSGEGPPLLFETMIFGGVCDRYQDRCSTLEEAKAMHARAVEKVRGLG